MSSSTSGKAAVYFCVSVIVVSLSEYREGRISQRALLLLGFSTLGFCLLYLFDNPRRKEMISNFSMFSNNDNKNGKSSKTQSTVKKEFRLHIADVRVNAATGSVEYLIEGVYDNDRWVAWRRYSELLELKRKNSTVTFPSKSSVFQWAMGTEKSIEFIDNRRQLLNNFLQTSVSSADQFEVLCQVEKTRHAMGVPDSLKIESALASGTTLPIAVKEAIVALNMTVKETQNAMTDSGGNGWEFYKRADGISAFLKKEGNFTFAMGRGPLDYPKKQAAEFMIDITHRPKWDDLFKWQKEIKAFVKYDSNFTYPPTQDPFNSGCSNEWEILGLNVTHTAFSSPAKSIVAERDTVALAIVARRRSDGAYVIALRSVEEPSVPEGFEDYTRAKIICAGFLFEDRTDGKPGCMLTQFGLVDPNGNIPSFIINVVAPQRAFAIRDVNRAAKQVLG